MEAILKKLSELESRISFLEKENALLKQENALLKQENALLKQENAELKLKLNLNSKNSSIPSSKELYKVKKNTKKGSEKNQGAQPGHKGSYRKKLKPTTIFEVSLEGSICACGGGLNISDIPYVHQKVDIPAIKPEVIDYHLQQGRCRKCGKRKSATLPEGVSRDVFGPRLKSAISSLTGFYKNSKREVESIVNDIFNIKISLGSISNSEHRISQKCKSKYEEIEQEVTASDIVHMDETSHYNKGKLGWCWMFASKDASFIKLEESRGKKVLSNSVFGSDDNIIVTDRYAAYNYFSEGNRQVCWAHLARDFERFSNSCNAEVSIVGHYLKNTANELFSLKNAFLEKRIDKLLFLRRSRKLRKRTWLYLKNISHNTKAVAASRVAKNILKFEDMMWRFLEYPENIPITNNHAERQIRHYVVYRKNSYFTQSKRGNIFLERIISLYLTWKQKNQNPFSNLLELASS